MALHFTNTEELNNAQADVLWESVATNPKLVRRPSSALNQQLDTRAARVISSINEIKVQTDAALLSVENALAHVNTVIGNVGLPEVDAQLKALGVNVIDAMTALNEKILSLNVDVIDGGEF